jgi:hypothetical protein
MGTVLLFAMSAAFAFKPAGAKRTTLLNTNKTVFWGTQAGICNNEITCSDDDTRTACSAETLYDNNNCTPLTSFKYRPL